MQKIVPYYSVGIVKQSSEFCRRISKSVGRGFANLAQNCNAGFKPTLYNIFSSILLNVFNLRYQTYRRKER